MQQDHWILHAIDSTVNTHFHQLQTTIYILLITSNYFLSKYCTAFTRHFSLFFFFVKRRWNFGEQSTYREHAMKFLRCNNTVEHRTTNHLYQTYAHVYLATCTFVRIFAASGAKIAEHVFFFSTERVEHAENERYIKGWGETIIRSEVETSKINADERVSGIQNEVKEQERQGGEICEEIAATMKQNSRWDFLELVRWKSEKKDNNFGQISPAAPAPRFLLRHAVKSSSVAASIFFRMRLAPTFVTAAFPR